MRSTRARIAVRGTGRRTRVDERRNAGTRRGDLGSRTAAIDVPYTGQAGSILTERSSSVSERRSKITSNDKLRGHHHHRVRTAAASGPRAFVNDECYCAGVSMGLPHRRRRFLSNARYRVSVWSPRAIIRTSRRNAIRPAHVFSVTSAPVYTVPSLVVSRNDVSVLSRPGIHGHRCEMNDSTDERLNISKFDPYTQAALIRGKLCMFMTRLQWFDRFAWKSFPPSVVRVSNSSRMM